MNELVIKVVAWGSYNGDTPKGQSLGWLGGWFNFKETGNRWKDYLKNFTPEAHPYLEAVRTAILERQSRMTGERHQYSSDGVPIFSDGKRLELSYRAWGDLMAAVWSEQEGKDYTYMDFYM